MSKDLKIRKRAMGQKQYDTLVHNDQQGLPRPG
jgi:hypothetical protein